MERTFVMIKPDGVRRKLIGDIISRIENRNFNIVAIKMLTPSRRLVEEHYAAHKGKDFFEPTVDFVTSGPVIAMIVEADNAIMLMRTMMGATNPIDAAPGTIRSDLTVSMRENLIHGSDSPEAAGLEIKLWFPELSSDN